MSNTPKPHFLLRNWENLQHYKNRNPIWVKLYCDFTTSEDWYQWGDASKLLAFLCIMLAPRYQGAIPANPEYVQRFGSLDELPDFRPLVKSGFLKDSGGALAACYPDASELLADGYQNARQRRGEERRGEETPPNPPSTGGMRSISDSSFEEFWSQYPRKDAKKKAESAWKRIPHSEHEAIFSALKRQISTVWKNALERKEKQFIPLPTSWLNGERWKDEAEATPALQNGRKSGDTWTPPQPPVADPNDPDFLFYQKLKAEREQE